MKLKKTIQKAKDGLKMTIDVVSSLLCSLPYTPTKRFEDIAEMSLYEKVMQMFVVSPVEIFGRYPVTRLDNRKRRMLKRYPVGGIVLYSSSLRNPKQVKQFICDLQLISTTSSGFPLLMAVDEEGGGVARIGRNPRFGVDHVAPMGVLSKTDNAVEEIRQAGATIGRYLHELGFNLNLAPVIDVADKDGRSVLGNRLFSDNPNHVAEYSRCFAKGLMDNGVVPCYKHFPGLGSAISDTHYDYVVVDRSLEQIETVDFVPFREIVNHHAQAIMVGHVVTPALDDSGKPASLSHKIVNDVLRGKLGFDNVVVTDALFMDAIRDRYKNGQAAVEAVKAGCDIILKPGNLKASVKAIIRAVENGEIKEERINQSVERIYKLKKII